MTKDKIIARIYQIIDTFEELDILCDEIMEQEKYIAMDIEFFAAPKIEGVQKNKWSISIIQITSSNGTYILDLNFTSIDKCQKLFELLARNDIVKVFHDHRQDYEALHGTFGDIKISNLFDTQLAYAFLSIVENYSYLHLVQKFLNIEISKECRNDNWAIRPLSPEQLSYAAFDVIYLYKIYPMIIEKLRAKNRLEWVREYFITYNHSLANGQIICEKTQENKIELSYDQAHLLAIVKYTLRKTSIKNEIAARVIATKYDLINFVTGKLPLFKDWRDEIFYNDIRAFLNGELVIRYRAKECILESR